MESRQCFVVDNGEVREEIAHRRQGASYWMVNGVGCMNESELYATKSAALRVAIQNEERKLDMVVTTLTKLRRDMREALAAE